MAQKAILTIVVFIARWGEVISETGVNCLRRDSGDLFDWRVLGNSKWELWQTVIKDVEVF